jgi:outer membrane receptor protein involved in Fe transport
MYRLLILFLLLAGGLPQNLRADSGTTLVSGQAIDSLSKKGIPFVTVTVQNAQSKVLKRLASDANGTFSFSLKDDVKGDVIVSAVGYKPMKVTFSAIGKKKENLGSIILSEASAKLGQVVVQAQKPLIKIEPDKISYNPEADPESQIINALDMMRKVPLLTVDGDDNIKLKGASNYKILINGKESPLMSGNAKDVLKSMPASSIKNIEVITNPSSKYSAEGIGGIINIVTNKKGLSGFSGNASLRADNFGGYGGNIYTTATFGKFAFSLNYGHNSWKRPASHNSSALTNYASDDFRLTSIAGESKYHGTGDYANGELSYEIDSLNLISASFFGYGSSNRSNSYSLTSVSSSNNTLTQSFNTANRSKNSWYSMSGNIDYQRSYKKPDKMLTASYKFDYNPQKTDYTNDITGNYSYNSSRVKSKNSAGTYESTFQLDFVNPITKEHQYEVGVKYILRMNPSDVDYYSYNVSAGTWEPNVARNNNLDYTQNIVAGYAGYLYKFKKFSFKTGVRVEGAYTDASFKQVKDTSFSSNLTDLVPYATISYSLSETSSIKLAYTQRLQRPGIWYLNPYINDENPKSISYGNPNLKTEKVNSFDLGYSYFSSKFNIDLSLYSRLNSSSIQAVISTLPTGGQVQTYRNTGSNNSYGASLYGSCSPSGKFSISLGSSAEYNMYEGTTAEGKNMTKKGWTKSLNGDFRWNFMEGFTFSGYGGYGSGWLELQSKSSSYSYNGVSLRKDFLSKKLGLTVSVNNPFKETMVWKRYTNGATFSSVSESEQQMRSFRFSISYRFGKMGQGVKKAQRSISNDDVKGGGSKGGNGGGGS